MHPCEPFQQQALGIRGSLGRRKVFDGSADVEEDGGLPEMRGGHRRTVRGQVGPASEFEIERFEPPRSLQEQRGGIVPVAHDDPGVAAQEIDAGALESVQRSGLGRGSQLERCVERSGLERRLRGRKRPLRTTSSVRGQLDRALQECGGSSDPTASLRPARGQLQLDGNVLVGPRCGARSVPGASVRVDLGVGGIGEGPVDAVAILRRR